MITKPTLLLDKQKCLVNIDAMCKKANRHGIIFRPHFKTHQSLEIGRWFAEKGVTKITVSSFEMAEYFSAEWNDITVAFPANICEIETINQLAKKINLNVLLQSTSTASFLSQHLKSQVSFFIKIDVGTHRTGINPNNINEIDAILAVVEKNDAIKFKGFLAHSGHTYQCSNHEEINSIHEATNKILVSLKNKYKENFPNLQISVGDTPGCSVSENFEGVDEIRPGNFIFYDLTQVRISSCNTGQVAMALACPIVALHPERNELIIYGGGIHFSKERMENEKEGTIYGRVVQSAENGWGPVIEGMYVKGLSQEHGIVSVPETEMNKYKIGDIIIVLPVHSCMSVHAMKGFLTTDGQQISTL